MPIYDISCSDCGFYGEVLLISTGDSIACPSCGGCRTTKMMAATSSITGRAQLQLPGPEDTACCGNRPGRVSGCAGPGSCCGKN